MAFYAVVYYYFADAPIGIRENTMRIRWILWLAAVVMLGGSAYAVFQEANHADLLKAADEMIQVTARLRGLQPKAPIARGVKSRDEITQYLNEQIHDDYSEAELQQEGKVLRTLGLIPATMDYKEFVLKLLSEQVAGFYDPERKTFFIASWLSAAEQQPVMVHELDHALQDQYFDISRIIKEDRRQHNDDKAMAHEALFEGDATVVMLNQVLEPVKRTFADLPDLAPAMGALLSSMQSQFPVFKSAPQFLQETVFFPYGHGASFIQKMWAQNPSWDSINKIYSDLPSSTEQIIHPEKYYGKRDEPKPVDAEGLAASLGSDWKVTYKNVLGEFSLNLVLSLHLSEERARRSATGWGGDQILLLENGAGEDAVLVRTVWDTEEDATKFFQSMQVWFQHRFPLGHKSEETATRLLITNEKEIHALRQEGSEVRFIIGFPESESKKLSAF
jgi:heme-degrading monooxygenase HmoA